MNERIRELAEEAGAETFSRPPMRAVTGLAFTDENLEKFAELIIKEVLAVQEQLIAEGHNAWHVNKPTREHFGVE
jgi:hypothetical protein